MATCTLMLRQIERLPFHPLLLAAYAVLFLYSQNFDFVRPTEVTAPLVWGLAGAALALAVAAVIVRDPAAGGLVATAIVAVFYGYGHVVELFDDAPAVLLTGLAVGLVAAAVVVALLRRGRLASVTAALNVVAVVLIAMVLVSIVPRLARAPVRGPDTGDRDSSELAATRSTQRDIYYLVFDRYGSASSLAVEFEVTNNDLPAWLMEHGFAVAEHAHANYIRTALSLASVLDFDYLDELTAQQGPDSTDLAPLYAMLQDHRVGRFLHEQGYRYVHIGSWWGPTRTAAIADESLRFDKATEFEVVLHETTAMRLFVHDEANGEAIPPAESQHLQAARFEFRALHRVAHDVGPKFVFAHILLPHPPVVFDARGEYLLPSKRKEMTAAQRFQGQLEYTNSEIRRIVELLLSAPAERRPIIIVQADEGPYPLRYRLDKAFDWNTATPTELEQKYGILDAFYLPAEPGIDAARYPVYPTMSSVNTFRLVFGRYFGVELPYLPDRSFTSRSLEFPYALTDVTDRLPDLAGSSVTGD